MKSTTKSLLKNRDFLLLWCAYGISAMGDHLSEMAILAHQDALDPSINITPMQARMTFVFMLPFFVLGPLAGAVADRFSRRRLMIAADLARVVVMLTFILLIDRGSEIFGNEWGPFLPLGIVGVFAAVFAPARQAMVPCLVKSESLVPANAMISGLGMIATMFAAVVSGKLADHGYIQAAFNLDAGTFAASAFCVFLICRRESPIEGSVRQREPFLRGMIEGFRYIRGHRRVGALIGIGVVFWFCGASVRSVVPAIVKDVYGGTFTDMAYFPAWIGLGLACGAVALLILGNALRSEMAITWSLFGTGLSVGGLTVTVFAGFDPSVAYALGAASVLASGFFGAGIAVSYNALLQKMVPNQYRGRVFGILGLATVGGLLVVTGTLGIPHWENLDQWAGYVLVGVTLLLFGVGALTLSVRLRQTRGERLYVFYRNITEFGVRFWYRLVKVGPCTVPREGPVIVTANHGCVIDPLLMQVCCRYRRMSFMIAAEYRNMPFFGHFIRVAMCIPVRRGEHDIGATKEALRRLHRGEAVGIFIQGGIPKSGEPNQVKNGVAMLALRTGAKVVPAHISGTRFGDSMSRAAISRHNARIVFGPAVDLSEFSGGKGQGTLDAASQKIYGAIMDLAPTKQSS